MVYNIEQYCKTVTITELVEMNFSIPHYQRENTWSPKQKQYLLDTILTGLPIPAFMLSEFDERISFDLVDAKHRYQTIYDFINNDCGYVIKENGKRYTLYYGSTNNETIEHIYNSGTNIKIMTPEQRSVVNSYKIALQIIKSNSTEIDSQIFKRVNASGKKANSAEIKASETSGSEYHVTLNSILKASSNVVPELKPKIIGFFECLDKEKTGTFDLRYDRLTNDISIRSLKYSKIFHKIEVYNNIAKSFFHNLDEPYDKLIFQIPNINIAIDEKIDEKYDLTDLDAVHDFNIMYKDLTKSFSYFGKSKFSFNGRNFNETLMCVFTALIKIRNDEIGPLFNVYWQKNFDIMAEQAVTRFPNKSIDSAHSIVTAFKFVNEFLDYAINKITISEELGK